MSTPYLQNYYKEKVVPELKKKHGYTNIHQVPRLEKIVVTSCMGNAADRKVAVDDAVAEIQKITGQRPSITYAKKSVANFKLRAGEVLGARVTLRGANMWDFLYRFINITSPNIRDFRGITSKSFDGRGNYALGVKEQSIFPEIELDQIKRQIGFDLIFVTSAETNDEGRSLLAELGMPFRDLKKKEEAPAEAAAQ
ncbi:MAG: 50S ribosomal protein L5 [Verrucomicrobiales bacterium]|nr:50S ribosomal protein L5 [Verrucomicrobiota bacterium JB025]